MITGHRTEGATSPSDRTARVLAIARRCLDETSTARFGSCREVIAALSEAQAHAIPGPQSAWPRTPVLVAAPVVAALSTGLVTWFALQQRARAAGGQIQSVAVLPLASLSRNPDDEIFNDFYTTKEGGTGLGLSIVRRLVMDLHGTVGVESELGKGTRITVDIPAGTLART
jgi:hypothetical protein